MMKRKCSSYAVVNEENILLTRSMMMIILPVAFRVVLEKMNLPPLDDP